jgi:hypothetical protein
VRKGKLQRVISVSGRQGARLLRDLYALPRNLHAIFISIGIACECAFRGHATANCRRRRRSATTVRTITMTDLLFLGLIVGFFALSAGLIRFCAAQARSGRRP